MKTLIVLIVPSILLSLGGCASDKRDASHDPWKQHDVTAWHLTPAGHLRDAGPFESVAGGWVTEDQIDQAADAAYARYAVLFPELPVSDHPFSINDDYVMWIFTDRGGNGTWAAGVEYSGFEKMGVTMFTRGGSDAEPPPAFIVRPPGLDQWGNEHPGYRYTMAPLLPALVHELLHTAIGDPGHMSPLWKRIS